MSKTMVMNFFQDRRGVGAVDYGFLAALTIGLRDLGGAYGRAAAVALKHAFGMV